MLSAEWHLTTISVVFGVFEYWDITRTENGGGMECDVSRQPRPRSFFDGLFAIECQGNPARRIGDVAVETLV